MNESQTKPADQSAHRPTSGQLALGCPVWAVPAWVGPFYSHSDRRRWLAEYSSVFNTVEGNSTFYALPTLDTVHRWAEQTRDGFEFALKVPRVVTHDHQLVEAQRDVEAFFERLEVLAKANRLGPSLLQLSPTFSFQQFPALQRFLQAWPREFPVAVEVRHSDYFDESTREAAFDGLLEETGSDRVLFDSRGLFSRPPEDETEHISQQRKPRSPFRTTVTGSRPFVRFIGRNRLDQIQPWIESWADQVAGWIRQGLRPLVFTHAPDDRHAPQFARRFHAALRGRLAELPELLPPPAEQGPQQLTLF